MFNRLVKGLNNPRYREKTASVLDQIKDSYRTVARKASRRDQQTLAQYLDSVRDVEKEIAQFKASADRTRRKRIAGIKEFTAARHMGQRIKAMLDLTAIAFWTDTTRVATIVMAHT